jgi:tRNA dimethylallyltransferase
MPEKNLIVLLGPTAVGKTDLSVILAKKLGAEIISADSRQFYKGLEIGTAAPTDEILSEVKHHYIGCFDIEYNYDIFEFEKDVIELLKKLFINHNNMILTGGSGLYIDAVCNGVDELPDADEEIRTELKKNLYENGIESLRSQLKKLDPDYYNTVDISNPARLIRAIEVCIVTGMPYSKLRKSFNKVRDFNIIKIGLNRTREDLYERINQRVDNMIELGLYSEAQNFFPFRNCNALNTVGYKELFDHFEGKTSFEEAVEKIKTNTRRYAKRQLTWFRRDKSIVWFHPNEMDDIIEFICNKI